MKKLFFFVFVLVNVVSCTRSQYAKKSNSIAYQDPIMPIHVHDTVTSVYLTDYLPLLAMQTQMEKEKITINHSPNIQILTFSQPSYPLDTISLVLLPNIPQKQNIVSANFYQDKNTLSVKILDNTPLAQISCFALLQNKLLPSTAIQKTKNEIQIAITEKIPGRSFLRIFTQTSDTLYNDILVPLENGFPITDAKQLNRFDHQTKIIYSLMIDRFVNGDKSNDWKMHNPDVLDIVDYQGGDIQGITETIKKGYFDSLGVNTLWISPITQNPLDAWGKYVFKHANKYDSTKSFTRFSGYHGYWPIFSTVVDFRFGSPNDLTTLLNTAHQHNNSVILDYVANHMHINSPVYTMHPDWHTDSVLPDGRRNFELWDDARLTTWFDTHIPTLDLEREPICQAMTDSALTWLQKFDFDGFRHDACKHIPESYWRILKQKIIRTLPNNKIWMIGETYGSSSLINQYVKSGMLDAQFDFNVYFSAIRTLCGEKSMTELNDVILNSLNTYGNHHTMGNISGNHDQVRWASYAGGAISFDDDGKELGWQRQIGIGNEPDNAYKRAILLHVLNATIPGVPCIYQGDEYAEVGGNDPDNRHMMRFETNLSDSEKEFKRTVSYLCKLRRSSLPLLYGDYIPINVDNDILTFDRVYMNNTIRVTIDRKNLTYSITTIP